MPQALRDIVLQNSRDIAVLKEQVAKILSTPTAAALTMDQVNAAARSALERIAAIEESLMVPDA